MLTNDNTPLLPTTSFASPNLEFDFPAFQIGVAEYEEGPTGCTVFLFPQGAATAVDIRGGYPGTVMNWEWNHAICLAGGSLYGLEASFGVAAELFAQRNYSFDDGFALVSGAIIFDYSTRENRIYPDRALGRAAVKAAQMGVFPLGARGAGRSATCGSFEPETSGQGAAFRQIQAVKVAVFTIVNCSGAIFDRQGNVVKGNRNAKTGQRHTFVEEVEGSFADKNTVTPKQGNTTLTVVVTNQKLSSHELTQWGRQVHSSMARVIQPFHSMDDGDVLYAVTTNEIEALPTLSHTSLGVVTSELAWDAILCAVGCG